MSKITEAQMAEMFEMQDSMNKKVNENWVELDRDWSLAGHMELMEAIDHWGWKWWKDSKPDLAQVQLEVVDAWHFFMSECIVAGVTLPAEVLWRYDGGGEEWADDMKKAVLIKIARGYEGMMLNNHNWAYLLRAVDLTPQALYTMYIQKNVLNHFRQDNGYKTGEYIKIWDGEEDNVHLLQLSEELIMKDYFSKDTLYEALQTRYEGIKLGQS